MGSSPTPDNLSSPTIASPATRDREQAVRPAAKHASVVIIGGSQAGLALGYYLKRERLPFVILEQASRIGDAWRSRWDSLTLFTPARYSSLPARRHCGVEYGASALFVVRSLDRRAIPESSNIRIYHGFGPDRLIIPCSGSRPSTDLATGTRSNRERSPSPSSGRRFSR